MSSPPQSLPPAAFRPRLFALSLCLASASCVGNRAVVDPVLQISTPGGSELGVATEFGVVFLGRTARSGAIEVTAWFGDGPSIEPTVIEPVGGGLYTAETEIRLPSVPMTFFQPHEGEILIIVGRTERGQWEKRVKVLSDPRVYGILLEVPLEIRARPDQIGAGVFSEREGDRRLVGLVSGRLSIESADGDIEYLTVMGPEDLWRLVTHRRDRLRFKPWVYRDDVM